MTETKEDNMSVELKSRAKAQRPSLPKAGLGLVTLEPRILLDAAGFVTGADIAMDAMGAQDAQLGVEAIFGNAESLETPGPTQDDDITSAPLDGPWLDGVASNDANIIEEDVTAAPLDGPWLGQIAQDGSLEAGGSDPTAAPLDGPWLDEITADSDETLDGDPTEAPLDGPWLDGVASEDVDVLEDEDPTAAPLDGPWL